MDDRLFKTAMGKFATGVTVVTTDTEDGVHGMTANAFMSVSMDPKLVLISVGRHANTHRIIEQNGTFAVNILHEDQMKTAQYFAKQLEEDIDIPIDRFEGQPIIEGSLANIVCTVYDSHEAGDHTLFIGQVDNLIVQDETPLLYFEGQFRYFQ
ncbi:flavin reductase family protein [Salibacterium halotolerans]|uniref:NADH-FMN oxidoreductase RutF, flavin reductase (DIM6/NTAB) family n=1 Tax=Salibacterium halotolerans TaxID=1884432 RepID=A0A1I5TP30_9BACI|nr:flavin reductase family protein [Salibacterium halotolerans]SFP84795.1 NADH-FMN oxidoreductase RutF, flavin reductase (DIM6/NTAB) family [Salibacterium halotolerans]